MVPPFWRSGVLHARRAGFLLYALLVACLATTLVLAYRARVAARFRGIAVERTLRGDAESAAWLFSAMATEHLDDALESAFSPLDGYHGQEAGAPLPPPEVLLASVQRSDPCPGTPQPERVVHRLDLRTGELLSVGPARAMAPPEWLEHELVARGEAARGGLLTVGMRGVVSRPDPLPERLLAYTVVRDPQGVPLAVYAFPTCLLSGEHSVFARVASELSILPPALTDSLPNDSLFSLLVTDAAGVPLYRSAVQYPGPYEATVQTGVGRGAVLTRLTLRPDVAMALVSGGLPRSQLPFLMLLLAASAVLLASALVLIRREEHFARMREEFLAGISHELRTPLAQIRMFAELVQLGRPRTEQERRRCLTIIDQEARRLSHLVDNVLEFTRATRSDGPLPLSRADLGCEIADTLDTFRPLAASRGTTVESRLADGLEADICPHALRQVLLNVLDNAVKFGPSGQTVLVSLAAQERVARITVDDEGPGIPKRERGRIWRPFYRFDPRDTTSHAPGSGLGLAVVRDLVRRMGGRVWVESAPRRGARVVIELRRAAGSLTSGVASAPPHLNAGNAHPAPPAPTAPTAPAAAEHAHS
ncbi:MAG TPA: HAMP domain-containing sensor histidine kinase [Gemmatimonadaceae bacterium]